MSRGPGTWQRKILEAIHTQDVIYLREVLPAHYTTAQRLACTRAMRRLAQQRYIRVWRDHYAFRWRLKTVVARPGGTLTRDQLNRQLWKRTKNWPLSGVPEGIYER